MSLPKRKRVRMADFDYSTPGAYFVTINARSRAPWFGTVRDGLMLPNEAGQIVHAIWNELPGQFPGIIVDAIIVMPDHVHGIVMLGTEPEIPADTTLSEVVGAFKSLP
jgi:putative transposase